MKVTLVDIKRVVPYARNPRKNEASVAKVVASLKEFGWRQPIVVDSEMVIVVGHTRYLAAQQLGMDKVPVHVADNLTPAQIKAYRIADNKVAELAAWDMDLLPIELSELRGMDVDLELLGFSSEELEKMLGASGTEGMTDPDAVPETPDGAVTAGRHLGPGQSPAHVRRLQQGRRRGPSPAGSDPAHS